MRRVFVFDDKPDILELLGNFWFLTVASTRIPSSYTVGSPELANMRPHINVEIGNLFQPCRHVRQIRRLTRLQKGFCIT